MIPSRSQRPSRDPMEKSSPKSTWARSGGEDGEDTNKQSLDADDQAKQELTEVRACHGDFQQHAVNHMGRKMNGNGMPGSDLSPSDAINTCPQAGVSNSHAAWATHRNWNGQQTTLNSFCAGQNDFQVGDAKTCTSLKKRGG